MTNPSEANQHALFRREDLTADQRDSMFALLSLHFEGVTRDQFEHDLAEKNWVVEIRISDRLVGFSTLLFCEISFEGTLLTAIYSGDTIVAPEAWGQPTLARAWIAAINHLRNLYPARKCYWLLLTSGFRTYRFLPVFWRDFYPRFNHQTPSEQQRLLEFLASTRYGDSYDKSSGIVRFTRPQKLREDLQMTPEGRRKNPDVAFFLTRNPGHTFGDELVCLTEVSDANMTAAGIRMASSSRP